MINCFKLAVKLLQLYGIYGSTTIGHNKVKIHRILLVWQRFVGSAFFELILPSYPKDLVGGFNTPGISREPELLWITE